MPAGCTTLPEAAYISGVACIASTEQHSMVLTKGHASTVERTSMCTSSGCENAQHVPRQQVIRCAHACSRCCPWPTSSNALWLSSVAGLLHLKQATSRQPPTPPNSPNLHTMNTTQVKARLATHPLGTCQSSRTPSRRAKCVNTHKKATNKDSGPRGCALGLNRYVKGQG